jgi:transcriptional regulator with XRE-family HTH domain
MALLAVREYREAAKMTLEDLAADTGVSVSQLSRIERDERDARYSELRKIADRFGLRIAHLVREPAPLLVPVIAWVSAGRLTDPSTQIDPNEWPKLAIADLPETGSYFATVVRGDSMDRYSPEGSTIIVDTNQREPIEGRAFLFSIRGETTYKIWGSEPPRLEPHSTSPANKTIYIRNGSHLITLGRVRRTLFDL